jgi:hypothetical protein
MQKQNRSISGVIGEVRGEVNRLAATVGHAQTPALYDESDGDFYFVPAPKSGSPTAAPQSSAAPELGKPPASLSITHNFGADHGAQFDVGEA